MKMLQSNYRLIPYLILFLLPVSLNAQEKSSTIVEFLKENKIDSEHAGKFGATVLQTSDGRIKPVNTFSSEILRKLHKSDEIWGINSDQFLLSLFIFPEMWVHVPFIHLPNKHIATYLGIGEDKNCSYSEFFDSEGDYKLQKKIEEIYHKPASERNKFEKDLLKLDEQINLFFQLLNFRMLNIFPCKNNPEHKWYAPGDSFENFDRRDSLFVSSIMSLYLSNILDGLETGNWEKADETIRKINIFQQEKDTDFRINLKKVRAELLYNKLNIFRMCKKVYLICGGILLLLLFGMRRLPFALRLLPFALISAGFAYHAFGICLRWYIAGYAPWSNSYETMVFVSLISILAGMIFYRKSQIVYALSVLFGGVTLFVSGLNWMDPQIGLLVPVLKSPWLMFHVAIIMISYGFFGISFLLGLTNLVMLMANKKKKNEMISLRIRELSIINEISLWTGLCFLTTGTFLGAIWANESWGRYWGWDPKETWALITIIAYTIVTHIAFINRKNNPKWLNAGSVIAFLCVLMTYFGVNYFLSGMHSYG